MTCPNCSSTDIIEIDSRNYCINCGQQVAEPKALLAGAVPKLQSLTPTKNSPEKPDTDKGNVQRIKVSLPTKAEPMQRDRPETDKSPAEEHTKEQHPLSPIKAQPNPHTLDLKSGIASDSRGTNIGAPQKPEPSSPPTPHPQPQVPPHPQAQPAPHNQPQPKLPQISHSGVQPPSRIKFEKTTRTTPIEADHPLKSALRVILHRFWFDIAIYSLYGSIVWLYLERILAKNFSLFPSTTRPIVRLNMQPLALAASLSLVALVILVFSRAFLKSKFIYAIVKQLDQRPGSNALTNKIALASLWPVVTLDIIAGSMLAGLLLLDVIGFHFVSLIPDNSGVIQPILLTLTNVGLVYLAIGVASARTLATRTSTLASRRASVAFSECWKLYWHYSGDIVIWCTESALTSLVIFSPLALILSVINPDSASLAWLALIVIMASVCGYLAFTFNVAFWTAIYYELCSFVPSNRRNFYVGPKPPKLSTNQLILSATVLLISVGLSLSGWAFNASISHWLVGVLK